MPNSFEGIKGDTIWESNSNERAETDKAFDEVVASLKEKGASAVADTLEYMPDDEKSFLKADLSVAGCELSLLDVLDDSELAAANNVLKEWTYAIGDRNRQKQIAKEFEQKFGG
jgi:hypothetical protein